MMVFSRNLNQFNIEDVVVLMCKYGKKCCLFKLDIQNVYKIVLIYYLDQELLGFILDQDFYVDKNFFMGFSYYCYLFEEFSMVVYWVCENKLGICGKLVYLLDDFLVMGLSDL